MTLPRLILPDTDKETVAAGVLGVGLWKKLVATLKLLGGGSRKQVIEHDGYEVMVEATHQHGQDSGRVMIGGVEFYYSTNVVVKLPEYGYFLTYPNYEPSYSSRWQSYPAGNMFIAHPPDDESVYGWGMQSTSGPYRTGYSYSADEMTAGSYSDLPLTTFENYSGSSPDSWTFEAEASYLYGRGYNAAQWGPGPGYSESRRQYGDEEYLADISLANTKRKVIFGSSVGELINESAWGKRADGSTYGVPGADYEPPINVNERLLSDAKKKSEKVLSELGSGSMPHEVKLALMTNHPASSMKKMRGLTLRYSFETVNIDNADDPFGWESSALYRRKVVLLYSYTNDDGLIQDVMEEVQGTCKITRITHANKFNSNSNPDYEWRVECENWPLAYCSEPGDQADKVIRSFSDKALIRVGAASAVSLSRACPAYGTDYFISPQMVAGNSLTVYPDSTGVGENAPLFQVANGITRVTRGYWSVTLGYSVGKAIAQPYDNTFTPTLTLSTCKAGLDYLKRVPTQAVKNPLPTQAPAPALHNQSFVDVIPLRLKRPSGEILPLFVPNGYEWAKGETLVGHADKVFRFAYSFDKGFSLTSILAMGDDLPSSVIGDQLEDEFAIRRNFVFISRSPNGKDMRALYRSSALNEAQGESVYPDGFSELIAAVKNAKPVNSGA